MLLLLLNCNLLSESSPFISLLTNYKCTVPENTSSMHFIQICVPNKTLSITLGVEGSFFPLFLRISSTEPEVQDDVAPQTDH